ncbi:DUF5054 domain-containing protein [Phyllobacterium sp. YR531]|uniref:DUF5054 domain-containing protein n=1 Tax=Phyllobacterium sp. YR531 TaxID=1144343 RepID=UPI00026F6393|nr:DUF5054 domain-containing protein [Phyllobacterium sp. YR531]EJN06230.1 glycosyl hydrolases family 38 [Phyllobacterium sp. YR531]
MTEPRIHLIFKTHLDIGFTDHAEKVRRQYHERFIPQAIETGEHFYTENPDRPKFIWTTGAWLIWDYLNTGSPFEIRRLEQAIDRGLIRWHGLPFTTHSELMSANLFRAGLSYSQELDGRFGKRTTAAKMTDVPGHTLGIVPLLAEAGIRFLHIGVNTASPPPDVPDVFRWRAPSGEDVVVMYQRSYGETCFPAGLIDGLSFAHTNDNIGPQSVSQTAEAYRSIHKQHPKAIIQASTLDDYGTLLWDIKDNFPIVEMELGDSWIHGSAADPIKTSRFLRLQSIYDDMARDGLTTQRLTFGRKLAMVAEHTCGVDIKSYLRDETAWSKPDFETARKDDFRFVYTEASWAEQRAYLDDALTELNGKDRTAADKALTALSTPKIETSTGKHSTLEFDGWHMEIAPDTGDIITVTDPGGVVLSGRSGSLIAYRYESYDADDINRHMDTYLTHREEWAILDHDKPGLARSGAALSKVFLPILKSIGSSGVVMTMPDEAVEMYGAPAQVSLQFSICEGSLNFCLSLHGKSANRMPEASFLSITPEGSGQWELLKMGLWHKSENFAQGGGAQLQAVSAVRSHLASNLSLVIEPLDTPLVAPQSWDFMTFCKTLPDFKDGIRFNIHNNKWGTNFPMWWEGDFSAHFKLKLSGAN